MPGAPAIGAFALAKPGPKERERCPPRLQVCAWLLLSFRSIELRFIRILKGVSPDLTRVGGR
jgi:hypothetical protein